jgi:hypothetical protein
MGGNGDRDAQTRALVGAATVAGSAPSIHNTQPWRWRIHDGVADLYADMNRHLDASDPDRRMLMVSCGAALHHAEVALAAEGFAADVVRVPDAATPAHVARVSITGRAPVTPDATRLAQTVKVRRTDRRPLLDEPVPQEAIEALRAAAASFDIGLDVLKRDQVIDLAVAIDHSQRGALADERTRAELDTWTGGAHPQGTGIPAAAIPASTPQTTVPARDFGHAGTLPISDAHDSAATYAILYGRDDEPATWLRAGEALSAAWLIATELSVALLPLSVATETPSTWQELRRIVAGIGYPCMAVRLGIADPDQPPTVRTPRLDPHETIEIID